MTAAAEKCFRDDLSNSLIDFKKKVSITALLNDYGGTLEQISSDLSDFVEKEEKSGKTFAKHFLIRGFTDDKGNQLITIVNQENLEKIQKLLRKPITLLFSAEETDGEIKSESPLIDDHTFQPVQNKWIVLNNVRKAAPVEEKVVPTPTIKTEPAPKKEEKKKDFFGAAATKPKPKETPSKPKDEPVKKEKGGIKNMFQKQASKPKPPEKTPVKKIKEEPAVQHSPNIFEESSDEEETLNAMKKELHESDEEMQEPSTSTKRRRIVDSEDEEEMPEKKVEKLETSVVEDGVYYVYEEVTKTYEDEDGFMVTKKERVRKAVAAPPPETIQEKSKEKKTPVKADKKKTPTKSADKKKAPAGGNAGGKKQGSITSFFTKK